MAHELKQSPNLGYYERGAPRDVIAFTCEEDSDDRAVIHAFEDEQADGYDGCISVGNSYSGVTVTLSRDDLRALRDYLVAKLGE